MAAFQGTIESGVVALTAATAKTILQLVAPTNHRLKILGWGVYFDGVSASAVPVVVRLLRQTTAGTASAVTPAPVDKSLAETMLASAQKNASAEPTAGDVLKRIEVPPTSGYEEACPFGQEYIVQGSGRVGIECNAPAGVNVVGWIKFEE